MTRRAVTIILLTWLTWAVILVGYMQLSHMRYAPYRPDEALIWTADETTSRSNNDKPYLLEPFLNSQVAWDSEFYLGIATVGYDNPDIREVELGREGYNMSYAFFPLYPYLMKVVRLPFVALGMSAISASTAAGVLISLLGTLMGMFALYDLLHAELGEDGALRATFLMLIFPTSLFLATVYTEGLFLGLSLGSLALMRRRQFVVAAILAALATWTRAVGGALLIPLAWAWLSAFLAADKKSPILWRLPLVLLPVLAYGLWRMAFGVPFDGVQIAWFGNQPFQFELTLDAWDQLLKRAADVPETAFMVAMGIGTIALSALSCLLAARRYPELALFGLVALAVPLTSGWTSSQSMFRYVLAVPTLWVLLGRWSRYVVFERAWTLFSILLLGMHAFLFSYDFWVA